MTPEVLVQKVTQALPSGIRSVVLYGSAAAGDHLGKRSDYNVLVVLDRLGVSELDALAGVSAAWVRAGNPVPLFLTVEHMGNSLDVFPIEFLDMKQSHRVLFGDDIPAGLNVAPENLRAELEHELKGKLIQLRAQYLLCGGKPRKIGELMISSPSTFLVLFRAVLRLLKIDVPAKKIDAVAALSKHVAIDGSVFIEIAAQKEGRRGGGGGSDKARFERYLQAHPESCQHGQGVRGA